MFFTNLLVSFLISLCLLSTISAWDSDDLSLFDIVEDVNRNFYEFLEVDQSASQTEIRRAYRKVSLQLHPDKNKDPDAENQFRKLVAAYEVLKDEKMRLKYNDILVNGLPDWRQPVYYYRRVRKMGLVELSILMSIILTVGHFLVIWSMYLERKFELEEIFRSKKKKDKKARKQRNANDDHNDLIILPTEVEHLIVKPQLIDLLPFLFLKAVWNLFKNLPYFASLIVEVVKNSRWFSKAQTDGCDCDVGDDDDGDEKFKQKRPPRQTNQFTYELAEPSGDVLNYTKLSNNIYEERHFDDNGENYDGGSMSNGNVTSLESNDKNSEWSDLDIEMLVKGIAKFPGGTVDRWEKISAFVGRPVKEVTSMSKKLRPSSQPAMSEMNNKIITKRVVEQPLLQNVELTVVDNDNDDGGGSNYRTTTTTSTTTSTTTTTTSSKTVNSNHKSIINTGTAKKPTESCSKNVDRTLMIARQQQPQQSNTPTTTSSLQQQQQQANATTTSIQQQQQANTTTTSSIWNQQQQKQLELAMVQISKDAPDRWSRIAELVPEKTKDECLQRVKYLAELVKKRKQQQQQQQPE